MGLGAAAEAGCAMNDPLTVTDAEQSVLGACMSGFNPDDLDLDPADFYQPTHGDVWAAITRVQAAGNRPDPVSVRLALADRKPPIDPVWLFDLTSRAPVIGNAGYYAEQVRTAAGLRALSEAGTKVAALGASLGDLEERREAARQAVDDACRGRIVTSARSMADLLPAALDAAQHGRGTVLPTGWVDLDRTIGGLAPGRLVIVGARPGGGKSLAGTNLALHFAHHHGHAVLIASLEMPTPEVMNRLLAAHASVNLTSLSDSNLDEAAWGRLAQKHDELDRLPIFVQDDPAMTVQTIRRMARDVQRVRDDLAVIVVDYLQLVSPGPGRRNASRAEEVSTIARDLKLLARETGACVVAMAQINREGAKADDGPRLTDIRDGGAENDADVVILLHRPNLDTADLTVTVAKNRHGPLGISSMQLQGHYARLESVAWSPSQAATRRPA